MCGEIHLEQISSQQRGCIHSIDSVLVHDAIAPAAVTITNATKI